MSTPDREVLIAAIRDHKRVTFKYQSATDGAATERVVDPWVFGSQNGKDAIFGFQVEGGSGQTPRRFNLSKVKGLTVLAEHVENRPNDVVNVSKWTDIYAQY